jgi:hypothetical protein
MLPMDFLFRRVLGTQKTQIYQLEEKKCNPKKTYITAQTITGYHVNT